MLLLQTASVENLTKYISRIHLKVVFHYQIYLYELTLLSLQVIKGRTLCFSTKKSAVRVVL